MATSSTSPLSSSSPAASASGAPSAPPTKHAPRVDPTASTLGSAKVGETASVLDTAPAKDLKKEKAIASSGDKKNIFQRIAQCFKNCFSGLIAWVARAFASKDNKAALKVFGERKAEEAKAFTKHGVGIVQAAKKFLAFEEMHPADKPLDGETTAKFLDLELVKNTSYENRLSSKSTSSEFRVGYQKCVVCAKSMLISLEYRQASVFFEYLADKKPSAKQAVFIYGQLPPAQRAFIESRFTVLCKYLNKEDKGFKAFLLTTDETKWSLMLATMQQKMFAPLLETPAT